MDTQLLFSRLIRCLLLDANAYEELRTSSEATASAVLVALVASYLAGVGGLLWTFAAAAYVDHSRFFLRSFLAGSAIQFLVFLLWVGITAAVLDRVFRVPARYLELLRVMGFGFAPVALQLVIFIPALDQPIGIIALGAALYTCTYAVQVSTIASAGQAFCASVLGFAAFCLILGVLGNGFHDFAPGLFALDPNAFSVGTTLPLGSPP